MKEVKFKQTEVGMIPNDWEVKRLGNLADIRTGKKNGNEAVENGKYLFFVRSQDVYRINTYSYDGEAILVPGEGNIGSIFHYVNEKFDFHQRVYKISDFPDDISCKFVYYVMKHFFGDWALKKTVKATVDSLRLDTFENFTFSCPPTKKEQTAIATTLGDIDAVISTTEKLIAKKKALKQGTMQTLLSGKMRIQNGKWIKTTNFKQTELGPIPQEWEVRRLGNLANIKTGKKNGNEAVENGKYPFFVRSQEIYRINTYSYDGEAILVPGEGNIGSIFHYVNGKFDFHQRVYKISDFPNNISCKFIYYVMKQYFGDWALKKTVKATVDSLRLDTFENFAFNCPSTKEEQTAIATILSDMDSEIVALETKLAKYRQLKTGMMQQLLTGKVRLV